MNLLLRLIIAALATWRVAYFISYEAGPWEFMWKIHKKLHGTELGKLISCVACSSVWLGIVFSVPGTLIVGYILAVSALAMFIEELYGLLREKSEEEGPQTGNG